MTRRTGCGALTNTVAVREVGVTAGDFMVVPALIKRCVEARDLGFALRTSFEQELPAIIAFRKQAKA